MYVKERDCWDLWPFSVKVLRPVKLFSIADTPFYILLSDTEPTFFTLLTTFIDSHIFNYSHPSGCELGSHCDLMCISLITKDLEGLEVIHFESIFAYGMREGFRFIVWHLASGHLAPFVDGAALPC